MSLRKPKIPQTIPIIRCVSSPNFKANSGCQFLPKRSVPLARENSLTREEVSLYPWPPVRMDWIQPNKLLFNKGKADESKQVKQEASRTEILPLLLLNNTSEKGFITLSVALNCQANCFWECFLQRDRDKNKNKELFLNLNNLFDAALCLLRWKRLLLVIKLSVCQDSYLFFTFKSSKQPT